MPKHITESDLQPQDSPGNGWYIIEVPGNYENLTTHGKRVVQELSAETLAAIAEAGVPAEDLPIEARITVCKFKERKEPHLHCFYLQKTGTPSSTGAN